MKNQKPTDGAPLFAVPPQALIDWLQHTGEGSALALVMSMAVKLHLDRLAKSLPDSSPHLEEIQTGSQILDKVCRVIGAQGGMLESFAESVFKEFTAEGAKLEPLQPSDPQEIIANADEVTPTTLADEWLKTRQTMTVGMITPKTAEAKAHAETLGLKLTDEKASKGVSAGKKKDLPPFSRNGLGGEWNPDGTLN